MLFKETLLSLLRATTEVICDSPEQWQTIQTHAQTDAVASDNIPDGIIIICCRQWIIDCGLGDLSPVPHWLVIDESNRIPSNKLYVRQRKNPLCFGDLPWMPELATELRLVPDTNRPFTVVMQLRNLT